MHSAQQSGLVDFSVQCLCLMSSMKDPFVMSMPGKRCETKKECWSNCSFSIPFFSLLDLALVVKCVISVLMFVCIQLCKFISCRDF